MTAKQKGLGRLKNDNRPHELSAEEARKGGKNSVEARRRKKTFRELIEQFGELEVKNPKIRRTMEELGVSPDEFTNDMAAVIGQYMQAQKGNTSAFLGIRDTKGEKPVDKIEQTVVAPKPLIDLTDRKKNGEDNGAK